jgi:hypothetical protein
MSRRGDLFHERLDVRAQEFRRFVAVGAMGQGPRQRW